MSKKITIKVNNLSIKGILENPKSAKIVILAHGFTGDLRGPDHIFEKLSKKLEKLGYATLRFSFRGTPPSEGEYINTTVSSQVEDLKKVVEHTRSLGYTDIALLGESMGGSIVARAYDQLIKAVVFWYPALDFVDTSFRKYLTSEIQTKIRKQGYFLEEGYKIGKQFVDEIPSINLYREAGEIKCPVLFVHGDKDRDVPHQQSEKAFQKANDPKEIHIIKDADHCFITKQDEAIDLTTDFFERYF
ncbi:MAG: hypothetical protein COY80_03675 [Candidatus Pacebacteria bacterium CG_4_10_14_0_8_um_filter_42_14]|nr:MAG: hypothetical protein COY80_03675 [Candidatus Pacebacteria bacterium CG_4_10_14_0_8_um_filter_42_14]